LLLHFAAEVVTVRDVQLLAVGGGPSNLGLAVAIEELAEDELARGSLLIEQEEAMGWQRGTLMPWALSQVSFLKDLVLLRNPQSRFTFLNYLRTVGRLDEFVNLGTFTPYRTEISDYLRWVAQSLERVRIEYGRRCLSIEPRYDGSGALVGWLARLADGSTIRSPILVLGVGRDARIPPVFRGLPEDRAVHTTRYLQQVRPLLARPRDEQPREVVVVGGAQGSAEMLWSVLEDLPGCHATLVTRSVALAMYQNSKFTNELYYPAFVDEFYSALPTAREQMLHEMHRTNYSGLTPELLDSLYRRMYLERLNGDRRIRILPMTDVTAARMSADRVALTLRDRKTGAVTEVASDLVLLGTGYERGMPALVRRLAAALDLERIEVTRGYRLLLPEPATAACYVQGVNEATHGIADSLLSLVASRSAEIVADVVAVRERGTAVPPRREAVGLRGS
jgi:L-ornithine N5-monooxygenase